MTTTAAVRLPEQSQVVFPFATQFDLASKAAGRTYRIMVFKPPLQGPPEGGYPVIVALDGNMCFPIAATLNGILGFTGAPNAIVVGVGYPSENPLEWGLARRRDLTPPTPLASIPKSPFWPEPDEADFGGADPFLAFLVDELRPLIAEHWQGSLTHQTLYGHSLAGLFVLHALFSRPDAFRNYVASSPSIWWNERAILKHVDGFAARVAAGEVAPRVLVSVGADEQVPPRNPPPGMTREDADKLVAEARMVDNAAELASRLAAVKGAPGYVVRYRPLVDDDHETAVATSLSRTLSFALKE